MSNPTIRRLTVVEQIYYQNGCNDPVVLSNAYDAQLESEEQAYVRYLNVGTSWVELDFGWVKPPVLPRLLHIHNQGNSNILLGITNPAGVVTVLERLRPGCTRRTEPATEAQLMLRLEDPENAGSVKVKIAIIPA